MNKQSVADRLVEAFSSVDQSRLDGYLEESMASIHLPVLPRNGSQTRRFQIECLVQGIMIAAEERSTDEVSFRGWRAALIRSESLAAWLDDDASKTREVPWEVKAGMLESLGRAATEVAVKRGWHRRGIATRAQHGEEIG